MNHRGKVLPFRRPSERATEEQQSPVSAETKLSDEALLMACVVGEQAALGTLYDRHNRPVYRFVSRISSGPSGDIDDLVQCTFIEVWKSARRFHSRGTVRSWIFGIAANVTRHYVRSETRRQNAMYVLSEQHPVDIERPDDQICQIERLEQLAHALRSLSYNQRVAFVLCDIEDLSGVEAAQTLGVRKGTLWRRLHDARKNLRQRLGSGETQ